MLHYLSSTKIEALKCSIISLLFNYEARRDYLWTSKFYNIDFIQVEKIGNNIIITELTTAEWSAEQQQHKFECWARS